MKLKFWNIIKVYVPCLLYALKEKRNSDSICYFQYIQYSNALYLLKFSAVFESITEDLDTNKFCDNLSF